MSKITPAVNRMADILRLFVREPGRNWSLTEIVDELGISRSTCHALLVSLDQADIVYRDAAKRYSLGALALSLGQAAASGGAEADLVRREIEELSRDFGTISVTNYRRSDGIFVRDWVDPLQRWQRAAVAGKTIPLAPPWGAVFYAWEPPSVQRRWLGECEEIARDDHLIEYISHGLHEIRERRFLCGIRREAAPFECLDMQWRKTRYRTDHFFWAIRKTEQYIVDFLAAPVIDANGKTRLAISLAGFGTRMAGSDILAIGGKLAARCRRLGQTIAH